MDELIVCKSTFQDSKVWRSAVGKSYPGLRTRVMSVEGLGEKSKAPKVACEVCVKSILC